MPKSGKTAKESQYGIDETRLIELVKRNPTLWASNAQNIEEYLLADAWDKISEELNAPVDVVKKKWLHITESHGRRKSLRSVHHLNFLPPDMLEMSSDNSCTSSNCNSPKGDGKRSMRSVSQVSTASETERASSTLASNHGARPKQIDAKSRSRMNTPGQMDAGAINDTQPMESGVHRFQERVASMKDAVRPALPNSLFLSSKEQLQNDVNAAARLLSDTSGGKNETTKKYNAADSTRAFFESMAMTVSMFPQHIQAALKVQICNLVGDAEYGLTIPKPC